MNAFREMRINRYKSASDEELNILNRKLRSKSGIISQERLDICEELGRRLSGFMRSEIRKPNYKAIS